MELPSAELEVWRYSRIGELDPAAFTTGAARSTVTGAEALPATDAGLVDELVASMTPHDVFDELILVGIPADQ